MHGEGAKHLAFGSAGRRLLAGFVRAVHLLFVAFVLLFPFLARTRQQLLLYFSCMLFMVLHWVARSDDCALTEIERWLRGVEKKRTLAHMVVAPIYDVDPAALDRAQLFALGTVWSVGAARFGALSLRARRGR